MYNPLPHDYICEYCKEVIDNDEYCLLAERGEYHQDESVHIGHKECTSRAKYKILQTTRTLYLIKEYPNRGETQ